MRLTHWWARPLDWFVSALESLADSLALTVWGEHGVSDFTGTHPALRHAEAQQVCTEVFRVQVEVPTEDDPLRALILSIAQATVEYVAEQDYESPADMYAERKQLAQEITDTAFECAAEWPDHEINMVREAMG